MKFFSSYVNKGKNSSLQERVPNHDECVIISRDSAYKGSSAGCKSFAAFKSFDDVFKYIENTTPETRNFYEIIRENKPQCFRMDIDLEPEQYRNTKNIDKIVDNPDEFINDILTAVERTANDLHYPLKGFIVTQSSTSTKISYHVIARGFYFDNSTMCKTFYQTCLPAIATSIRDNYQVSFGAQLTEVVDNSVYSRLQNFRLFGCCKPGKNNIKTMSDLSYSDDRYLSLITHIETDDVLVTIDPIAEEPKKKTIKTDNGNSNDNIEEVLYLIPNDDTVRWHKYRDIGMMIHEGFAGSEEGLELWKAWGSQNGIFGQTEGIEEKLYNSFSVDKGALLTAKSLWHLAKETNPQGYSELFASHEIEDTLEVTDIIAEQIRYESCTKEELPRITREIMRNYVFCGESGILTCYHYVPSSNKKGKALIETPGIRGEFHSSNIATGNKLRKEFFIASKLRYVDMTDFLPGEPLFTRDANNNTILNKFINADYTPDEILSMPPNDTSPVEYHLRNIICNGVEEDFIWFRNWITSCLMDPTFNPHTWPMVVGAPGAGKGTYFKRIFEKYFGPAFTLKDNGSFSEKGDLTPLIGKSIFICDEVRMENKACYNKLKTLVTEDSISYREMYKGEKVVKNYIKGILISNHPKPIKDMLPNERRFAIFKVSREMGNDEAYFKKLFDDIPWTAFPQYFIDYGTRNDEWKTFSYNNYKTKQNAVNASICMDSIQELLLSVIRNYSRVVIKNSLPLSWAYNEHCTLIGEGKPMSKKLLFAKFDEYMSGRTRPTIHGKRVLCFSCPDKDKMVDDFKRNNGGFDPLDYIQCHLCGAEQSDNCSSCGKDICDSCGCC